MDLPQILNNTGGMNQSHGTPDRKIRGSPINNLRKTLIEKSGFFF
jgi:hypothetical protein